MPPEHLPFDNKNGHPKDLISIRLLLNGLEVDSPFSFPVYMNQENRAILLDDRCQTRDNPAKSERLRNHKEV